MDYLQVRFFREAESDNRRLKRHFRSLEVALVIYIVVGTIRRSVWIPVVFEAPFGAPNRKQLHPSHWWPRATFLAITSRQHLPGANQEGLQRNSKITTKSLLSAI